MKNNILKIIISLNLLINLNGSTLNLDTKVYESTPTCATGLIYNAKTGICEKKPVCSTGTLSADGSTCEATLISEGTNIYTLKEELVGDCSVPIQTVYTPSITEKLYEDKLTNYIYFNPNVSMVTSSSYPEQFYTDKVGVTYKNNGTANTNVGTVIDYISKTNTIDTIKPIVNGTWTYDYWNCDSCGKVPVSKVQELIRMAGGTGNNVIDIGCTYSIWNNSGTCKSCSEINCYEQTCDSESCSNTYAISKGVINDSPRTVQLGVNSIFLNVEPGQIASVEYKKVTNATTGEIKSGGGKPFINLKSSTDCQNWQYRSGSKDFPAHYYCADNNSNNISTCPAGYLTGINDLGLEYCYKNTSTCPTGYTDNGTSCQKTVNFNFYNYTCTNGFIPTNTGFTTYTKTDPNNTIDNTTTLDDAINTSVPPTNNCIMNTRECPSGYTAVAGGVSPNECVKTEIVCMNEYTMQSNGTCLKQISTCPSGTVLEEGICKQLVKGCPTGYTEVTGEEKACKKENKICPFLYTLDPSNTARCKRDLPNFDCKKKFTCEKNIITCPAGSIAAKFYTDINGIKQMCTASTPASLCSGNNICISNKMPYCELGYTYSAASNKCEAPAFCEAGYVLQKDGCKRDYSYSIYSCGIGFEGPLEEGFDCNASCGSNQCSCNPETPPANNCKKRFSLGNDDVVIRKQRNILSHETTGTVSAKEYNISKNYACGDNCLDTIVNITGKDNKLCFNKENGSEQCITVDGCGFEGTIKTDKTPNDLFDLNVDSQNVLSLTDTNLKPDLSNVFSCENGGVYLNTIKYCEKDSGPACPSGYVFNKNLGNKCVLSGYGIINRTSNVGNALVAGNTWSEFDIGSYGGCAGAFVNNIKIKYNHSGANGIELAYQMISDYNPIEVTKTATLGTVFEDFYYYGRDVAHFKIDFSTGLVYRGQCKRAAEYSPAVLLEGFGINNQCNANEKVNEANGRCLGYTNPTCADGFSWDNTSRSCFKISPAKDYSITSTCKMNGHIGWHSRNEGIVSVIQDPNAKDKLLFWDSFQDKSLGFLEFVKDVKEEDRKEDFIPENKFLYEMLSENFTAIDVIENNTFFVSSTPISNEECTNIATKKGINKATISDNVKESLKKLSGNRYQFQSIEPKCTNSIYSFGSKACISTLPETNCLNGKYDIISGNYIWDNSQGDSINIYTGLYAPKEGVYTISLSTMGSADLYIDGTVYAITNPVSGMTKEIMLQLNEGLHEIRLRASKNFTTATGIIYGNRGVSLTIKDPDMIIKSETKNWCKINSTTSCPVDGYVKSGNLCFQKTLAYCETGSLNSSTGLCDIAPKCILVKGGKQTFHEQEKVIKEETRPGEEIAYKCSPLTCVDNSCQTATCPTDVTGTFMGNIIDPKGRPLVSGECVGQVCDAKKEYYEYCGRRSGCDTNNPLIYEENGICKEMFCATGYTMDILTKKCKKLQCPSGTTATTDGSCLRN